MKLRLRLRTLMIAIALLSPILYAVIVVYRQGGPAAYRSYHGHMAARDYDFAERYHNRVRFLRKHASPGHLCASCSRFDRPLDHFIADAERRERDYRRMALWHRILCINKIPRPMNRL